MSAFLFSLPPPPPPPPTHPSPFSSVCPLELGMILAWRLVSLSSPRGKRSQGPGVRTHGPQPQHPVSQRLLPQLLQSHSFRNTPLPPLPSPSPSPRAAPPPPPPACFPVAPAHSVLLISGSPLLATPTVTDPAASDVKIDWLTWVLRPHSLRRGQLERRTG